MSNTFHNDGNERPAANDKAEKVRAGNIISVVGDGSRTFELLTERSGFDVYAIVDINHIQNGFIRPVIFQNNLPHDLLQAILSSGDALGQCSLFEVFIRSSDPFAWKTGYNAITGEKNIVGVSPIEDMFDELLEAFGIYFGRCVHVTSTDQKQFVVVFMGQSEIDDEASLLLDQATAKQFARLFGNGKNLKTSLPGHLSETERQCFQLLAEGYSPDQIAKQNNISGHTLNLIFGNVCNKLSASTLAHALLLLFISDRIST